MRAGTPATETAARNTRAASAADEIFAPTRRARMSAAVTARASIVTRAHNLSRPVLDVAPRGNPLEISFRQRSRRPSHELAELLLAERLGASDGAPSLSRLWPRVAVLDALDPKHDENRIRPRAGKGGSNHLKTHCQPIL